MSHFNPSKVRGSWKKIAAIVVSNSETTSTWLKQAARPTTSDYLKNTEKCNKPNQPQLSLKKIRQLFKIRHTIGLIAILESNARRLSTMLPIEWCSTSSKKRSLSRLIWQNWRLIRSGRNFKRLSHHLLSLPMKNLWYCTTWDEKWRSKSIKDCNPLFRPFDPNPNPNISTPIIHPTPSDNPSPNDTTHPHFLYTSPHLLQLITMILIITWQIVSKGMSFFGRIKNIFVEKIVDD